MVMDREQRRRKIMERGSDRLALITGQLQNLDPSSPSFSSSSSSSASHNRTYSESFMPQTKSDHYRMLESPSLKYQFKDETKAREEPKLSTVVHKPIQSEPEPTKPEEVRSIKSQSEPTKPEEVRSVKGQSQPTKPEEVRSVKGQSQPTKPEEVRSVKGQSQRTRSLFSSKKLNASIISSERTRSLSSLAIAAFVVLLPRLNILRSGSILALRPLWLLLITDCAIIMSHLNDLTMEASGEGLSHEVEEEEEEEANGKNGESWSDAEKLLERGVVVYQALRGIFMDCSLYMVVVICGLCLL